LKEKRRSLLALYPASGKGQWRHHRARNVWGASGYAATRVAGARLASLRFALGGAAGFETCFTGSFN
jgi:hypothetical protein